MEFVALARQMPLHAMDMAALDDLWNEIKTEEARSKV
jgi:hypothetical protein